jgi:pyridoxine/pyridoxamine 5'-phosphate oxidase
LTDRRVVFENREHDFPQRIPYWRGEKNRLHARIEGELDGRMQAEEGSWSAAR